MSEVFFRYKNEEPPEKGKLLISEPHLPDTNFERTVILLCEHNEQGSFGFVLNKESNVNFGELIEGQKDLTVPVRIGGPVEQNTLHYLHNSKTLESSQQIGDEVYWGGDFDMLLDWLATKLISPQDVRFYLGYSGWGEGQLEKEIAANSWIVYNPKNLEEILNTPDDKMWSTILEKMGGRFAMYSKYPADPRLN